MANYTRDIIFDIDFNDDNVLSVSCYSWNDENHIVGERRRYGIKQPLTRSTLDRLENIKRKYYYSTTIYFGNPYDDDGLQVEFSNNFLWFDDED